MMALMRALQLLIKRILDFAAAGILLTLTAPLLLLALIAIRIRMGAPLFFVQTRPGLNGKPFKIYKLRTMRTAALGQNNSDAERLTPLGRWLRRSSLDEIPQLYNVLRGELSLVGPRPLLMEYLPLYNSRQARRHQVLPGITGWAQVNGRNLTAWEQRFEQDVWYVENWSLGLDLRILWMTVIRVFSGHGVSAAGEATMTAFTGTPPKGFHNTAGPG
jgi:lipopolysaccharide/colanic/teichoic acid biosynthesis glycosyltransferase